MSQIRFNGVSKIFRRHTGQRLLRQQIRDLFRHNPENDFYAIRNVSFDIAEGERVAVVGRNGAGKSTLLSLVCGLAAPDRGSVEVRGKVAALLELGSGFHPDLTGEENIFLNASLLGFTRARTKELYQAIVDFAAIGDFINEPLRAYSTGMIMRLAFSVALNLEPAILIIDEVLAVGDQAFQEKCFEKVMELRDTGRTLLCVSHNPVMLMHLCERALWLDHGEVVMDGAIGEVLQAYGGQVV